MPVQLSYPGVYVEEIPSGVRTITGVATSITAFIGRALMGPEDDPITITSYGDYERTFGGLWTESTMSYAVRDFYLNGGNQAIIIRIINEATTASIDIAVTNPAELVLEATSPGEWGDSLSVAINHDVADPTDSNADNNTRFFNLEVYSTNAEGQTTKVEEYLSVSLNNNDARYLPRVLEQSSALLGVANEPDFATDRPPEVAIADGALTGGDNGNGLVPADYEGNQGNQTGLYALERTDLFNLLCIPPPTRIEDTDPGVYQAALAICYGRRAMLLVDSPLDWGTQSSSSQAVSAALAGLSDLGLSGTPARNAMLYYPRVIQSDPNRDNQLDTFVPCGIIAGLISQTDTNRGIWKSPAGTDTALNGVRGLQVNMSDLENGRLNPLGINCLRNFPTIGRVVWGARTMRGADLLADEYKYLAPRRTALYIEESLSRGLKWVVFEPNDEPLWAQIRLNVGAFMHNLFRQGAFQGSKKHAYFVKCDSETTTQNDINLGIVNVLVGFAPLKPTEFVIIKLQQMAGQVEV